MIVTLFWCAYTAWGTPDYLPITCSWFAAELSMPGQYGGCKQRGQPVMISLKNALFMPRLAICSRDLHCHWINRTLHCDTMELSMLSRAWLTIPQHVFLPALTGRRELISRKIVSGEPGTKLSRWADFTKKCLPRIGSKVLPRFREKYRALGRQSMGSNMQPLYIQFRDIHDRDISGLHCILSALHFLYFQLCTFYIVSLELSIFSALNFLYCQPWTFYIVSLELSILSALNFLYCQPWTFYIVSLEFLYCQPWISILSAMNILDCQPWTF